MNYKVKSIPNFDKALKRLSKKLPSLKAAYIGLLNSLQTNPRQGTALGNHCLKSAWPLPLKEKAKAAGPG